MCTFPAQDLSNKLLPYYHCHRAKNQRKSVVGTKHDFHVEPSNLSSAQEATPGASASRTHKSEGRIHAYRRFSGPREYTRPAGGKCPVRSLRERAGWVTPGEQQPPSLGRILASPRLASPEDLSPNVVSEPRGRLDDGVRK